MPLELAADTQESALHDLRLYAFRRRQLELLERIFSEEAGRPLDETLVRMIEEQMPGGIASILFVQPDGLHLGNGIAPRLPEIIQRATEKFPIGAVAGSCGTAAYRKEQVIDDDIESDSLWEPYRFLALPLGLRACWSQPILCPKGILLGTFAVYYRERRKPSEEDMEILRLASQLAALAICRTEQGSALRVSQERYSLVERAVQDGIWDWAPTLETCYVSENWRGRLGYEESEIALSGSALFYSNVHPDDQPAVERALREHMTIRAPLRVEARMRGRDVGWLWVLIRGEALRDSTGNVVRVLGSLTDITERKIVEQQLVAATSRFEALFIGSPDALLMVDRSGKIALANRAAGEMFCRNLEAFQNVAVDDVLIGSTPYVPKLKQTQIDITKPEPVGLVGVRHDGEQFPAEVTTRAIQVEPEEMWVFSIRDVTARIAAEASRQEMERKLQETQRLESLGVLARGIAHDFNNLLANIVGNVALVKFESEGNALPPALDEAMDGIQEASQRAAELCRQMLAYAGKGQIAKQLTDLTTLVRGSERLLRVSVNKRVALEFELPETTPGVEVDVTQISQVLMNLVINASESMGERCGRVRVSTGSIDLEQVIRERFRLFADIAEGRYAFLEVDDDGTGMSESTLARIFDPFFTTKFTGRGLGLAVVLGIVRGHGGAVAVRSVSGQGTVYRVLLPIAPPVALQSREVAVPVKRALRYGGCALVVDDERNVRVATGRLLQALGFEAVLADGCDAAVRFVKERGAEVRFAMIDLNMPGLGGSATARELRQSVPTLPIILISAYGRPEPLVSGSGSAGSTLFLQKPFLMRDVIDKLETLIGEQEADAGACPD